MRPAAVDSQCTICSELCAACDPGFASSVISFFVVRFVPVGAGHRRGCGCAVFPSPCLCHVGSLEPVRLESAEEEQEQSSVQVPKKVLGDSMSTIIRLAQGPIGRMIFPSARLEGDIPEHGREHLAVDLHSFREIMCQP